VGAPTSASCTITLKVTFPEVANLVPPTFRPRRSSGNSPRRKSGRRITVEGADTVGFPTVEQIAQLQNAIEGHAARTVQSTEDLIALSTVESDLLTGYVHQAGEKAQRRRRIDQLQDRIERQRQPFRPARATCSENTKTRVPRPSTASASVPTLRVAKRRP